MSEPLPVIALLRQLVQKEITLGVLRAEQVKIELQSVSPENRHGYLTKEINELERDASSLTHRLAQEIEK